jgi:hypothetical protein
LGRASTLDAIARLLDAAGTTVIIGPLWLGEVLSKRVRVLLLTEAQERQRARRAARRTKAAGHRLTVVLAGVDLPIVGASVDALLVEGASTLDVEALGRWTATLVPALRPGGRLITADATDDAAIEARLAGGFLAAALTQITQERPRQGVVLTTGVVPAAPIVAARFRDSGAIETLVTSEG